MSSPEMNLPHQELAAKSVERVDKLIDNAAAARVDAAAIASATERSAGLKERLKGLETGGNLDSATAAELSEDIAKLETHLLTRGEVDQIPLDSKDGPPLDDAQKAHIKKLIFAKPSWLQEKIADPTTSPETVALYKAAVDARGVATENAGVEQTIREQNEWGKHNNDSARAMADIVSKFLDKPMTSYDAYYKGDIDGTAISDAWDKMDEGSKQQLRELANGLVSETLQQSNQDGTTVELKSFYKSRDDEKSTHHESSILSRVLSTINNKNPDLNFVINPRNGFESDKDANDKKPVGDIGKRLRDAFLASKAPKAK